MAYFSLRIAAALLVVAFSARGALAQSGDAKPAEQPAQPADNGKEPVKIDEYAEAARVISGPAGNAECVWHGRRVISLLWRDDIDTAFRHLDLYDRFGCPAPHVQAAFRCLIRQGSDSKTPDLHTRVHTCWLAPNPPAAAASSGGGKR